MNLATYLMRAVAGYPMVTEQVAITGGGSAIQSKSTNVSSTIVGQQIGELPWTTRDAMQLILTLPGVQTPGTPRTSSINGLPKSSLNITIDGANVQDNFLKSSDGFFTSTQAKSDAVEEVTLSTAVPGSESAGGGAVQIKFVTKSGSNEWHGGRSGSIATRRSTPTTTSTTSMVHISLIVNTNFVFARTPISLGGNTCNCRNQLACASVRVRQNQCSRLRNHCSRSPKYAIDGLPRDFMILNQVGGRIGGPISIPNIFDGIDRAFFFVNYEEFRLPQNLSSGMRQIFTYKMLQGDSSSRHFC